MNENIIGKRLKHKDSPDNEAAKVVHVGEEWVDFDNKTSVLKEKIKNSFVEIKSEINDAEAFLENSATLSTLMHQISSGQKGGLSVPDGDGLSMRNNVPSVELSNNSQPLEMTEAQQYEAAKAAREEQNARNIKAKLEQENWARQQGLLDDDGGEETIIDASTYLKENTPLAKQALNDVANYTSSPAKSYDKPAVSNPVAGLFESMKRSKQITIQLEVTEMIPKIEAIKNFEDMFSFDIVEMLSVEITSKLLKNPKIIEEAIKKQLESLIRPKKKRKVLTVASKKKAPSQEDDNNNTNSNDN